MRRVPPRTDLARLPRHRERGAGRDHRRTRSAARSEPQVQLLRTAQLVESATALADEVDSAWLTLRADANRDHSARARTAIHGTAVEAENRERVLLPYPAPLIITGTLQRAADQKRENDGSIVARLQLVPDEEFRQHLSPRTRIARLPARRRARRPRTPARPAPGRSRGGARPPGGPLLPGRRRHPAFRNPVPRRRIRSISRLPTQPPAGRPGRQLPLNHPAAAQVRLSARSRRRPRPGRHRRDLADSRIARMTPRPRPPSVAGRSRLLPPGESPGAGLRGGSGNP